MAPRRRGGRLTFASGLVALLAAGPEAAASLGRARVIDAAGLAAALAGASPPVVLDARTRHEFEDGHLPGSQRVDWRDYADVRPGTLSYLFGDPSRWGLLEVPGPGLTKTLRALGLSASRPVVVLGSPEGWGEEGRIAWMLLYLGIDDVALLDGGFSSWRQLPGRAVERGPASAAPAGDFTPTPRPSRRFDLAALREALSGGSLTLLDARTVEEFEGKRLRGQKRGGRIPGARLVPAASLRNHDGTYVSAAALSRLAGALPPGAGPITYCTGGVRSALLAVLLEARLGVIAANYDGSLWEWSSRPDLPLETGRARPVPSSDLPISAAPQLPSVGQGSFRGSSGHVENPKSV